MISTVTSYSSASADGAVLKPWQHTARVAVDLRSPNEETVLHLAARRGSREVTQRLLAHPAVDPWLKNLHSRSIWKGSSLPQYS